MRWEPGCRVSPGGSDTLCMEHLWGEGLDLSFYCPPVSANAHLAVIFGCLSTTQGISLTSLPLLGYLVFLGTWLREVCYKPADCGLPKWSGEREMSTLEGNVSWGCWFALWSCLCLPVGSCRKNRLLLPPVTCCGCGYLLRKTNWQACCIDLFTLFYDKNDHVPWIIQSYMSRFAVLAVWPFSFDHCWFFHLQEGITKTC